MDEPTTPYWMLNTAESLARQLRGMPEAARDSELVRLKGSNPTLHALVKYALKGVRDVP